MDSPFPFGVSLSHALPEPALGYPSFRASLLLEYAFGAPALPILWSMPFQLSHSLSFGARLSRAPILPTLWSMPFELLYYPSEHALRAPPFAPLEYALGTPFPFIKYSLLLSCMYLPIHFLLCGTCIVYCSNTLLSEACTSAPFPFWNTLLFPYHCLACIFLFTSHCPIHALFIVGNRRKLGAPPERYISSCSRAAHPFSCWECRTAPSFPCWPCCPVILMVGIPHGSCTSMPAVLPTRIHAGNAARPLYFYAGCVAHLYPYWERRTAPLFPC